MSLDRSTWTRPLFAAAIVLTTLVACSTPRSVWVGDGEQYAIADVVREVAQEQGFVMKNWNRETTDLDLGSKEITTTDETVRWRPQVRMQPSGSGWILHIYVWRQEGEMDRGVEVETEESDRDDDMEIQLRNRLIGELQRRGFNATIGPE